MPDAAEHYAGLVDHRQYNHLLQQLSNNWFDARVPFMIGDIMAGSGTTGLQPDLNLFVLTGHTMHQLVFPVSLGINRYAVLAAAQVLR